MEESDKELASSESADESNRAPAGTAAGRIDLQYTQPDGRVRRSSLTQFALVNQYDARNRFWRSAGRARDRQAEYGMQVTCDVRNQILTVTLNNHVFTVPGTHMHATVFNAGRTLEIGFLKDAEAHTEIVGDQYLIERNSRLKLSL
jgi:hypothetical protein